MEIIRDVSLAFNQTAEPSRGLLLDLYDSLRDSGGSPWLQQRLSPLVAAVVAFMTTTISLSFAYYLFRPLAKLQPLKVQAPLVLKHLDAKIRVKMYIDDCLSVMAEGLKDIQDGVADMYRMSTADGTETIILGEKYLPELRNLPDAYLSFPKAMEKLLAGKWAHIADLIMPWAVSVIKSELTPGIPRLMPVISEEIDVALERFMPPCDDWTPVCIYALSQEVVSQVSARVFVGLPLCRNARWQELCRDYTDLAFGASREIKRWKPWQRPFVALFIPKLRQLLRARRDAIRFMKPYVKGRAAGEGAGRDDFTEWIRSKTPPEIAHDYNLLAEIQCQLAVAAIHTTSMGLTHSVYDLVQNPEYLPVLRAEVEAVVLGARSATAAAGGGDGYDRDTMAKLRKVDSFIKEVQRFNPAGFTTFKRMVMRDVVLSDGKLLPAGTLIEVDGYHRYFDPATGRRLGLLGAGAGPEDGDDDEDGDEAEARLARFDGLRFYRLRQRAGADKASHQFATSNNDYLQWGLGRHACPGRFFASNEIKSILSKLLLKYDVAAVDPAAGRPANDNFGSQIGPNKEATVLFRRRK